ncbi:unnamed protein product, partial [Rotaria sp. Silwood1]
ENGINVVHIESRRSRRTNSEYEIYVDLEADRSRINESMQQLKRQVSCVRIDLNNLTENINQNNDDVFINNNNISNGNGDLELHPSSPFLDKNGDPIKRQSKNTNMELDKDNLQDPLELPSSNLKSAFNRQLYISPNTDISLSILCYDGVLCYLSNIMGQGSLFEIEDNLKRYFSLEDINQAYFNLQNCLNYCLSTLDSTKDNFIYNILQQCSIDLINSSSSLLLVMETIYKNHLFSYLPLFVSNDWLHMIRSVQNIEQLDMASTSIIDLQRQLSNLKDHLTPLQEFVSDIDDNSSIIQSLPSTPNNQCCLRTYCNHNTSIFHSTTSTDSRSSSWASLNIETNPMTTITGFIRNPVTNFMMPTTSSISDQESSIHSIDSNISSEDDQEPLSKFFNRSLSYQSSIQKTGSILVKRDDTLWVYPAAVIQPKINRLFSSVHEDTDEYEVHPMRLRSNSCDTDFRNKKILDQLLNRKLRKPKKFLIKSTK